MRTGLNAIWMVFLSVVCGEECLEGVALLDGIRTIIGADGLVPPDELHVKPFVGSFSTIKTEDDTALASTTYCMTDNACGHWDAYSSSDVSLTDLSCNVFCYIPKSTGHYTKSNEYTTSHPPPSYLNCGWETCG